MVNLDKEALIIAQKMVNSLADDPKKVKEKVKELENQLTKSLGILTESGVYALFVYLLAKRKEAKKDGGAADDPCHGILRVLMEALKESDLCALLGLKKEEIPSLGDKPESGDAKKVLDWASGQVGDLGRVLLLRDFLLRVFTYGRYCATARKTEVNVRLAGGGRTP